MQNQIGSLKESTDTGVSVKWLPAQLDTVAPAISTSSSSSSSHQDSAWNRGSEGQGYQQPDERHESVRDRVGCRASGPLHHHAVRRHP